MSIIWLWAVLSFSRNLLENGRGAREPFLACVIRSKREIEKNNVIHDEWKRHLKFLYEQTTKKKKKRIREKKKRKREKNNI